MSRSYTRRSFLQTSGMATVAAAGAALAGAPEAAATPAPAVVLAATAPSAEASLHLARRLTFGLTPQVMDRIQTLGVNGWLEEQLHPETINDSLVEGALAQYPSLAMSNEEINNVYGSTNSLYIPLRELQRATVLRAVYSQRQLFELMVDFWANHLNVHPGDGQTKATRTRYDREVLRAHALGRFADLLLASAQDPAMLFYLDNYLSKGDDPNENYARELLELHTVGVDGRYTEEHVRDAAYVLTGWSINFQDRTFLFRANNHNPSRPLRVKGWRAESLTGNGYADGVSLINYLARHRQTAEYLAYKLCVRFVGDNPPPLLVKGAAQTYLDNDTEIKPVLHYIFRSPEFYASAGRKFKRPFEFVAGAARTLNAQIDTPDRADRFAGFLLSWMRLVGGAPLEWSPPNGYPDVMEAWASTNGLLNRWNHLSYYVPNATQGIIDAANRYVDHLALLGSPLPQTPAQIVDRLAERLVMQPLDPTDRMLLFSYIGVGENDFLDENTVKLKAPQVTAFILNAPFAQFR